MSYDRQTDVLTCSNPGCEATIKNDYWGKVKSGWFFERYANRQWCPQHYPAWVSGWRANRAARS